jgi:hypothetical protein
VDELLYYKWEGRGFDSRLFHWIFSIYLILPAALNAGVYSVSNRNEYQKQKYNVSGEVMRGRCVRLTSLGPAVSRLSRQCGILNTLQPYTPPRPLMAIDLLYFFSSSFCSTISFPFNRMRQVAFAGRQGSQVVPLCQHRSGALLEQPRIYTSAVQRSYVLGHNSLMPMDVRAPPPPPLNMYYSYYYYYY